MIRIVCALMIAIAGVPASAAADEIQSPPMVAFVVGLESYKDPELNKLKYPAQDARDVFEQLQEISSFQKSRSRLLLAERSPRPDQGPPDPNIRSKQYWTAQEIRNEFRDFLDQLKDGELVVIYVGGHGFAARDQSLMLTASDFDPVRSRNDIPYSDLIGDLRRQIEGNQLAMVRVAMFLNVCGAGNAGAMNVTPDLVDAGRKLNQEFGYGKFKYSLFPATARLQNAFEDEGRRRSVFAYYLIEGLRGAAADRITGAITAGPLFDYIEKGLNKFQSERHQPPITLPRTIDKDMVIGLTQRQRGRANYIVGMSLLAASREIFPPTEAEPDREARATQSTLLADLAIDQFTQALRRNPELKARARLRRSQARLLSGSSSQSEDVAADLQSLQEAGSPLLTIGELAQVEALGGKGRPQTSSPPTLRALRDGLKAGEPFHTLLMTDSTDRRSSKLESWEAYLSGFPGRRTTAKFMLEISAASEEANLPPKLLEALQSVPEDERKTRLMVVYSGPSIQPSSARSALLGVKPSMRLLPFGRAEIEQIAKTWGGPITVILDAPFGGVVLDDPPLQVENVSLFLAAREPNGMTFTGQSRQQSTTELLIAALQEGVEDYAGFQSARTKWQELIGSSGQQWVVGTPGWFPVWGPDRSRGAAQAQLEPLIRWSYLVGRGCQLEELAGCDAAVNKLKLDPMQALQRVSSEDLLGRGPEVSGQYYRVSDDLEKLASAAPGAPVGDDPLGTSDTRSELRNAAEGVRMRADGASSKSARTVHIITMGVEDYKSPLIADLPGTSEDLRAYRQTLTDILTLPGTVVETSPISVAATARDILDALSSVAKRMEERPQDLAVFVFSGRGIEINGRRYLASASLDVVPSMSTGLRNSQSDIVWNVNELVDLWQISQLMRDRWFVGIYDAQFTAPTRERRSDQILDKHVDSVRPRDATGASVASEAAIAAGRRSGLMPRGDMPSKQVHIWLDGRVTAQMTAPHACAQQQETTVSPIATAIVSTLHTKRPGTYRDWMKQLEKHECLREPEILGVRFQGEVDLPVFASGNGAQLVEYFHSNDARRELNLKAAMAVTAAARTRYPSVRNSLSDAALFVTLLELYRKHDDVADVEKQREMRDRARRELDEITLESLSEEGAEDLWAVRCELLVRLFELGNDPNEAVRVLHQVEPKSVLARRNLALRLVELTRAAIDQQSTVVLEKTEGALEALKWMDQAALTPVQQPMNLLRRSETQRRAEVFSIAQPAATTSP